VKGKKIIKEIDALAAELTGKFKMLLTDNSLTAGQDKAAATAYNGLLFWRRTDLALMIKTFDKKGASHDKN